MYCAFVETTGVWGVDGVEGVEGAEGVDGVSGTVGVETGGVSWEGASGVSSGSFSEGGALSSALFSGRRLSSLFPVEGNKVSSSLQAIKAGKRERDKINAVNVFIGFIITSFFSNLFSPSAAKRCIQR